MSDDDYGAKPAGLPGTRSRKGVSDRRYREMMTAGLDLLDQRVTVFDRDLRLIACNKTFLRLLDFPEHLAEPESRSKPLSATTPTGANTVRRSRRAGRRAGCRCAAPSPARDQPPAPERDAAIDPRRSLAS